jgi:hypothetical protein
MKTYETYEEVKGLASDPLLSMQNKLMKSFESIHLKVITNKENLETI